MNFLKRAVGFFARDDDVPVTLPTSLRLNINNGDPYAAEAARQRQEMGAAWAGRKRSPRLIPAPSALEAAMAKAKAERSPADIFLQRCERHAAAAGRALDDRYMRKRTSTYSPNDD